MFNVLCHVLATRILGGKKERRRIINVSLTQWKSNHHHHRRDVDFWRDILRFIPIQSVVRIVWVDWVKYEVSRRWLLVVFLRFILFWIIIIIWSLDEYLHCNYCVKKPMMHAGSQNRQQQRGRCWVSFEFRVTFSFRGIFPYSTVITHTRSNKQGEQARAISLHEIHSLAHSLTCSLVAAATSAATLKPAAGWKSTTMQMTTNWWMDWPTTLLCLSILTKSSEKPSI